MLNLGLRSHSAVFLSMDLQAAKWALLFFVGIATFLASLAPWAAARCLASRRVLDAIALMSSTAAGIVLGALLCHILPESSESYNDYLSEKYGEESKIASFPFAGLVCGSVLACLVIIDAVIVRRGFEDEHGEHGHSHGEGSGGHDHLTASMKRLAAMDAGKASLLAEDAGSGVAAAGHILSPQAVYGAVDSSRGPDFRGLPAGSPPLVATGPLADLVDERGSFASFASGLDGDGDGDRIAKVAIAAAMSTSAASGSIQSSAAASSIAAPTAVILSSGDGLMISSAAAATGVGADAVGSRKPPRGSTSSFGVEATAAPTAQRKQSRAGGSAGVAFNRSGRAVSTSSVVSAGALRAAAVFPEGEPLVDSGVGVPISSSRRSSIAAPTTTSAQREEAAGKLRLVMRAWLFFVALSLHGIFDGLSVASENDPSGFTATLVAVLSHKLFDGLAVGVAVFPAGLPALQVWLILIVSSLSTPLGIGIGMAADNLAGSANLKLVNAVALSLASGSFAYISLMELLPSSLSNSRLLLPKLALFVAAFLAMSALAYFV